MGLRSGLPTKVTAQWFKPKEYDIANTWASLADPLGTMITCLLAPFVAKEPADLWYLQVYISIPVFLSFIGSLFITQEGYENKINKQSFKVLVVVLRQNFWSNVSTMASRFIHSNLCQDKNEFNFSIRKYKELFTFIWLLYLCFYSGLLHTPKLWHLYKIVVV